MLDFGDADGVNVGAVQWAPGARPTAPTCCLLAADDRLGEWIITYGTSGSRRSRCG